MGKVEAEVQVKIEFENRCRLEPNSPSRQADETSSWLVPSCWFLGVMVDRAGGSENTMHRHLGSSSQQNHPRGNRP